MKYYYAQYDNGDYIDLWRFDSKDKRNQFVIDRPRAASAITAKLARLHHREQFLYWGKTSK